jgi:hypothetical protein
MRRQAHFMGSIFPAAIGACTLFSLFFLSNASFAQQDRGKVQVDKDPRVDSLVEGYIVGGKANPQSTSSDGFRVLIFSGSSRNEAYNMQAKFQEKYPDVRTYIAYREPDFRVKVGDYRSRLEAEKMVQELRRSFAGLFIVAEKINPPKLETQ